MLKTVQNHFFSLSFNLYTECNLQTVNFSTTMIATSYADQNCQQPHERAAQGWEGGKVACSLVSFKVLLFLPCFLLINFHCSLKVFVKDLPLVKNISLVLMFKINQPVPLFPKTPTGSPLRDKE